MTAPVRSGIVLACLVLASGAALAQVYKSVDEHGNVVFSQHPPKDGKAELVTPRYTKQPDAAKGMTQPSIPQSGAPDKRPEATPAAKPELTPEQQAAKEKNCATAQAKLTELHGPRATRLQYINEKQELAFLTPELLEARIKEAEAIVARDCPPTP